MGSYGIGVSGETERMLFDSNSFKPKLFSALATITHALNRSKRPYIALSGGKDSLAVMALTLSVRDDVPMMWSDDELEYPETVAWMEMVQTVAGDQLIIGKGWTEHAGWFRPWRNDPPWRKPLPGTVHVGMEADDWMAGAGHWRKGAGSDLTILGTRASESRHRRDWFLQVRSDRAAMVYPVQSGTGRRCCPIWDWTDDDVWALITGWRLPYNTAYDRMAEAGVAPTRRRVGPMPLVPRQTLEIVWPDLLTRLEDRYGQRWR